MSYLRRYWRNSKEMPWYIGWCQGGMVVGPLFMILVAVPIVPWKINGNHVSYEELWRSGSGPEIFLTSLLLTIGTWGMAAKYTPARWAIVLLPIVLNAELFTAPQPIRSFATVELAMVLGFSVAIYFSLFHTAGALKYFKSGDV